MQRLSSQERKPVGKRTKAISHGRAHSWPLLSRPDRVLSSSWFQLLYSSLILRVSELRKPPRSLNIVNTCQCQPCTLQGAPGMSGRDSGKISHELCMQGKLSIRYVCSPLSTGEHMCIFMIQKRKVSRSFLSATFFSNIILETDTSDLEVFHSFVFMFVCVHLWCV